MKRVEVVIRPEKLDSVRRALEDIGCGGLMVSEIEGHGKQKGVIQQWRGEKYKVELLPKTKIDVVICDKDVERVIKAVIDSAKTGQIGDGKIFVSNIDDAVRIRTGERGDSVL